MEKTLKDGQACGHLGCLSHISHPCEGCGRVAGQSLRVGKTLETAIEFARKHGMAVEEFQGEHDVMLRVTYPSGEYREMIKADADAPQWIRNMTCNLL